ncbi:MAG: MFS transporter [Roseiflexaceae bacterium]
MQQSDAIRIGSAYSILTLSDGALRMLVLFHYYTLGYNALDLAFVFVLYELFGVVVNLFGGQLANRIGLLNSMRIGMILQIITLCALAIPTELPAPWYVMLFQGFAGISKDITKISAKSAITTLSQHNTTGLFRIIAVVTGAKNALKGAGFFVGGLLLVLFEMRVALVSLAGWVSIGLVLTLIVTNAFPPAKTKSLRGVLSPLTAVNRLAAARIFLFGARDVWQAIALPIFVATAPNWGFWQSGSVMALYTIGYGFIQAFTPRLLAKSRTPDGRMTAQLAIIPAIICIAGAWGAQAFDLAVEPVLFVVLLFSIAFAINSAVHSFLIAAYAEEGAVSLDIGLYYSANALGRLFGTLASGWCYLEWGIIGAMIGAGMMFIPAAILAWPLPTPHKVLKPDALATTD